MSWPTPRCRGSSAATRTSPRLAAPTARACPPSKRSYSDPITTTRSGLVLPCRTSFQLVRWRGQAARLFVRRDKLEACPTEIGRTSWKLVLLLHQPRHRLREDVARQVLAGQQSRLCRDLVEPQI